jgi:hypothetical protein
MANTNREELLNDVDLMDPSLPLLPEEEEYQADHNVRTSAFDESLVKDYPKSNKRLSLQVSPYSIDRDLENNMSENSQSVHISPYGIEFKTTEKFQDGDLVKIRINLPDYWERKKKLVAYNRIDSPDNFKILAKVVKTSDEGKLRKKRLVTVQTIVIDSIDEQVLEGFLKGA